jgi:hypothetical protein
MRWEPVGPETFLWLSGTAWSAIAAIATAVAVLIAVLAAILAIRQLRLTRELEEEKARPYVIAFIDESQADRQILDFVVRNVGSTAARDLTVTLDPPYVRSSELVGNEFGRVRFLLEPVSMLPPGGELRNFMDTTRDISTSGRTRVPMTVRLEYKDRLGKTQEDSYVIDPFDRMGSVRTEILGLHSIAKTLRAIAKKQGINNF